VRDPGRFRLDTNWLIGVGGGLHQLVQLAGALPIGGRQVDLVNEGAGENGPNSWTEGMARSQVLKPSYGGADLRSRTAHRVAVLVDAAHAELRFTDDD
jgi:hypothetical protein